MKLLLLIIVIGAVVDAYGQITQKDDSAKYTRLAITSQELRTYIQFTATNDIKIFYDNNLVGYKMKDSGWVLINPDKTRVVLDSAITNYFIKPKHQ